VRWFERVNSSSILSSPLSSPLLRPFTPHYSRDVQNRNTNNDLDFGVSPVLALGELTARQACYLPKYFHSRTERISGPRRIGRCEMVIHRDWAYM
jgi:hypothetical protein